MRPLTAFIFLVLVFFQSPTAENVGQLTARAIRENRGTATGVKVAVIVAVCPGNRAICDKANVRVYSTPPIVMFCVPVCVTESVTPACVPTAVNWKVLRG